MFIRKFLLLLLALFSFSSPFAALDKLNEKLGGNENPILSPSSIENIPYAKAFLEMNVVPMLVWNNEGGLIAANDAYLKMIGYTREEMRAGKIDWVTVTPAEYRALDQNCIQQLKTQDSCTPYVKEYIRKDGTRIAIKLWNAHAATKDGKNLAIILPF